MSIFNNVVAKAEYLTSYKIDKNITLIECNKPNSNGSVSIYLVEGEDKCLVIDTGYKVDSFLQFVKQHTNKPLILFLTHGHFDHSGNIDDFDTVYMNQADVQMIPNYKGNIVNVKQGYEFDLGKRILKVIDLAGHTPGSLGLLDEENKILFCGDAIGNDELWMHITNMPLESILGITDFLIHIQDKFETIYVGHLLKSKGPLDLKYIIKLNDLVKKIVYGGDFKSEPYKSPFPVKCNPLIVKENGIVIIYDPSRIHYV